MFVVGLLILLLLLPAQRGALHLLRAFAPPHQYPPSPFLRLGTDVAGRDRRVVDRDRAAVGERRVPLRGRRVLVHDERARPADRVAAVVAGRVELPPGRPAEVGGGFLLRLLVRMAGVLLVVVMVVSVAVHLGVQGLYVGVRVACCEIIMEIK